MGYRDPALHILASSLLVFAFQFAPCVAPRDAAAESIFLAAAAQGAGSNALQLGSGHYFARGINLSSAEFKPGKNPGIYGKDYIYPPAGELDYYRGKGFTVVRLPFRWERLQHSLFGELDPTELGRIKSVLSAAPAGHKNQPVAAQFRAVYRGRQGHADRHR